MNATLGIHRFQHFHISILAFLISLFLLKYECIAKEEKISRYQVKIELLTTGSITIDGVNVPFVLIRKNGNLITGYQSGDPDKIIQN